MTTVLLELHDQLDLPTYRRIALDREPVAVADQLLDTVRRTRQAFSAGLEGGASEYGVNPGLGYIAARNVNVTDQAAFQRAILAGRAAGLGGACQSRWFAARCCCDSPASSAATRASPRALPVPGGVRRRAGGAVLDRQLPRPGVDPAPRHARGRVHPCGEPARKRLHRLLDGILDALELALAHELVALRQARFLSGAPLPALLEHAISLVGEIVPEVATDRALAGDVERARELIASGRLVPDAPTWVPLYGE